MSDFEDLIPAITCLVLGGLFLLGGLAFLRGSLRFRRQATWVPGKVARMEVDPKSGGAVPVILFRAITGEAREYRALGASAPNYKIGADIGVWYFPDQPDRVRLDSLQEMWLAAIIFAGIGLGLLVIGGLLWQLGSDRPVGGLLQLICGLLALLAWYGAVRVALASRTLLSHGARAEGEVIGFWKYRSVETGRIPGTDPDIGASDIPMMHGRQRTAETVSPIIRFQPLNGAPVDIVGRGGLRSLGAKVTVVYSPAAPDRGRPLTFVDFWIVPLVLFGCGAIAVLAMVVARVAA